MFNRSCFAVAISAAVLAGQAHAEASEIEEEIIVVAHPLSGEGLSQAAELIEGEELARIKDANIGNTLGQLPGIHNASFGSAVGRPVIHGLGGPRVRVMEDRIDTMDVAVTSADHATAVEPFIAERVEVLKGPSTLLYGTGAIGGVVDVHTNRIPHETSDTVWGGIETRADDNANGTTTAGKLNGSVGKFAWHLDAAFRDGDEYEIPGFAESSRLREAEEAEHEEHEGEEEEEHEEEEEVRGELPGSQYDSESYAGGISYVGERGFIGIAVSRIEADYGLPGGHEHEHEEGEEEEGEEEEEGNPTLEMEQTRTDVEMGLKDPFGNFTSLNVRIGYNDYEHTEIEPNGEPATDFSNEAWELRTELVYEGSGHKGAFGLQYQDREFSALGEEAFIDPVDTVTSGVFWVGEKSFEGFDLEGGLRLGRVEHDPEALSSESFSTWAVSVGAVVPLSDAWQLGLIADAASRAPVAEELFSDGAHLVTNAYEIGDPTLDNETALNFSATLTHLSERWESNIVAYITDYSDFIFESARGDELDGLPVFVFQQQDAQFVGLDADVAFRVASWDQGEFRAKAQFDIVSVDVDDPVDSDLPRMPPKRFGVGFELSHGPVFLEVDYLRAASQGDVRSNEFSTDEYDDLRAYLGFNWAVTEGADMTLFVLGKNLTDDEQRLHTSFIKDVAPAPGRTIEAGLRLTF